MKKDQLVIKRKTKVLTIFIALLVLVGWFYWFQYRPSEIRSHCHNKVREKRKVASKYYKVEYDACLHEKGLK